MRQSSNRTRRVRPTLDARVLLACAVLAGPVAVAAQAPATAFPSPPAATRSVLYADRVAGARRAERPATLDRTAAAAEAARMDDRHVGAGTNAALMIVGVAGIVTGALVGGGGGTAIAVAGAVVGLYGLYRFVR